MTETDLSVAGLKLLSLWGSLFSGANISFVSPKMYLTSQKIKIGPHSYQSYFKTLTLHLSNRLKDSDISFPSSYFRTYRLLWLFIFSLGIVRPPTVLPPCHAPPLSLWQQAYSEFLDCLTWEWTLTFDLGLQPTKL